MKITRQSVEELVHPGGSNAVIYWDDDLTGFALRIYPSGQKSFLMIYRYGGRQHKLTIGNFPRITVDQAKKIVQQKFGLLAQGIDPAKKQETYRSMNELLNDYLRLWAEPHKKTLYEDRRRIEKHIRPRWGSKFVNDIDRSDIEKLYEEIGRVGRIEANRVLSLLSKIFDLAERWGFLPRGTPNPARVDAYKGARGYARPYHSCAAAYACLLDGRRGREHEDYRSGA